MSLLLLLLTSWQYLEGLILICFLPVAHEISRSEKCLIQLFLQSRIKPQVRHRPAHTGDPLIPLLDTYTEGQVPGA